VQSSPPLRGTDCSYCKGQNGRWSSMKTQYMGCPSLRTRYIAQTMQQAPV